MGHDAGQQPPGVQPGEAERDRDDQQQRHAGDLEVRQREGHRHDTEGHPAPRAQSLQRAPQHAAVEDLLADRRHENDDQHDQHRGGGCGALTAEEVAHRGRLVRPDDRDENRGRDEPEDQAPDPERQTDLEVAPRPHQAEVGLRTVAAQPGDEQRYRRGEHGRHREGRAQRDRARVLPRNKRGDQGRDAEEHQLGEQEGAEAPAVAALRWPG
ncbi:hypothetical protein HOP40_20690 [Pseudonocardia broussonetiae]|uniref:Uncharacterized protein n=1 Tax=Pseudonocardia broussonetiae TaxID=2736640 RepID=A0A6M6JB85_9PSEU|nr:hypothetical protein [Pseudonocardia broussonetiae]QJY44413.1 hypothetical protein HOP40_20690 [Pseudonocardia broussonetiae]